ncbi:vomeronasal type-1 receptor 3-like [Phascolarctos cinereus]|uniref:Vomeronasal type-1 receptor n=1 Tax=Phascolarctos cinereus TaxID=38626 RepID=A0A6P5IY13_PHACI|nr:vomeronasal type-1 receptor 3-like [Phascolarctos cinereus]
MLPKILCLGVVFFSVTTVGTTANFFLFTSYMLNVIAGHKISSLTLIFTQLTLVNSIALISKGVPQILQGLGWNYFLDDVGCKIVFYFRKLSEGLSISLTCLLCTFQAITISPNNSRWAEFKVRLTQYTNPSYLFCWILNLLVEIPIPVNVRGPSSRGNFTNAFDSVFCTSEYIMGFYLIMATFRNMLCLGLMILASGYMVLLLHKHHQHVQKIRSTKLSPRKHPEIRATQTILLLMSTFVIFYALTSILTLFLSYFDQNSSWMLSTAIFLSLCYPAISPLLLIPRLCKPTCNFWVK